MQPWRELALLASLVLALALLGCKEDGARAGSSDGKREATLGPTTPSGNGSPGFAQEPTSLPEPRRSDAAGGPSLPVSETCATATRHSPWTLDDLSRAREAGLKEGDSERYYYGIGVSVDYDAARRAAALEASANRHGLVFGDITILMMLYANGFGVARDLDVAIALACEVGGAPAELELRINHLRSLRSGGGRDLPFDVCDDITSGYMEGWCLSRDGKLREQQQERELKRMSERWSVKQRQAFAQLQDRAREYWLSRRRTEVDQSVPFASLALTHEELGLRDDFFQAISAFDQGQLPTHTADEARAADTALNETYRALMSADFGASTVRAAGVRATEKRWLAYRTAWVAFGAARFPDVPSHVWEAWCTLERTKQLSELLPD